MNYPRQAYACSGIPISLLGIQAADMATRQQLGQAIRRRRVARGINQTRFAEAIGYEGQSTISRIEHGEQELPQEKLAEIARVLDTRVSVLWAEAEEMPLEDGSPAVHETAPDYVVMARRVPLVSWVNAGLPLDQFDPYMPGNAEDWIGTTTKVSRRAYALRVRGPSMTCDDPKASFPEGTTIIVDPDREPFNGAHVIVRFDDSDEATFKKLVIDGPTTYLMPLNRQFPTIPLSQNATLRGVVVSRAEDPLGEP